MTGMKELKLYNENQLEEYYLLAYLDAIDLFSKEIREQAILAKSKNGSGTFIIGEDKLESIRRELKREAISNAHIYPV